jgi:hypothetical protein
MTYDADQHQARAVVWHGLIAVGQGHGAYALTLGAASACSE